MTLDEIKVDAVLEEKIKKLLSDDGRLRAATQCANKKWRKVILDKFDNKCSKCGTDGKSWEVAKSGKKWKNYLEVHHLKYSIPENCLEYYDDVVVLCHRCHYGTHWKNVREKRKWV